MQKYLATDLDGTLFFPKLKTSYVSKQNINALKCFDKNIIIVSGRNQEFIKKVCKELNIDQTFIACNGGAIYYKGNQIHTSYLDTKVLNKIIDYVRATYAEYKIILFDEKGNLYSLSNDIQKSMIQEKELTQKCKKTSYTTNKNPNTIRNLLEKENSIIKVNIYLDDKEKLELYEFLFSNGYDLSYALCKGSLELTKKDVNKGNALEYLAKYMRLNKNDIYVIGDDNNDIPMFEKFTNSFLINHSDNRELKVNVKHTLNKFKDIENYLKED